MDTVWHLRTRSGVRRHGLASADSGRVGALTYVATTWFSYPRLLWVVAGVIGYNCNNNQRSFPREKSSCRGNWALSCIARRNLEATALHKTNIRSPTPRNWEDRTAYAWDPPETGKVRINFSTSKLNRSSRGSSLRNTRCPGASKIRWKPWGVRTNKTGDWGSRIDGMCKIMLVKLTRVWFSEIGFKDYELV